MLNVAGKISAYNSIAKLAFTCAGILCAILLRAGTLPAPDTHSNTRKTDSLEQLLTTPVSDTLKLKIIHELIIDLYVQEPHKALDYAKQGILICERNPQMNNAGLLNDMGIIYQMLADYSNALLCHFRSLRLLEAKNDTKHKPDALNNIGLCYLEFERYDLAERYFKEAFRLRQDSNQLGSFYNNMGIIEKSKGNMYQSIAYHKKAIEINNRINVQEQNGYPYVNLGNVYTKLGQLDKAAYYYKQALQFDKGNMYHLIQCNTALGELYIQKSNYSLAEKYLFTAKDIAEQSGVINPLATIYYAITKMYEKRGDYKSASIFKDNYYALRDSIHNEKVTHEVHELNVKYESDKKDKEIQITQAKVENEHLQKNFIIVIVTLILITGSVTVRNIVLKQRVKNKVLNEKNIEANLQKDRVEQVNIRLINENIMAKYEVLKSKTNPHFLFNSLNILSSIVIKEPESALEYIENFSELYRMILKTGDQELISLHTEMQIVSHYIYMQKIRFRNKLFVDIAISLDKHRYFVPPFTMQMVVENAIKHNVITSNEHLHISVYTEDDRVVIVNNLQRKQLDMPSTLTGQKSITDRYGLLTDKKPVFMETATDYVVTLPLLENSSYLVPV